MVLLRDLHDLQILLRATFLWGHIKGIVYNNPDTTIVDLKTRIRRACMGVRPDVLRKAWDDTKLRLTVLLNVQGGHIESLIA